MKKLQQEDWSKVKMPHNNNPTAKKQLLLLNLTATKAQTYFEVPPTSPSSPSKFNPFDVQSNQSKVPRGLFMFENHS